MAEVDRVRSDPQPLADHQEPRVAEIERKTKELVEFRDAGVLTEAELEEQKVRLRWGLS